MNKSVSERLKEEAERKIREQRDNSIAEQTQRYINSERDVNDGK